MPLGVDIVELPMIFALQKVGLEVRDAQQTMLEAREIKNKDELMLLNMSAAMVDGVYQEIAEKLKPGMRESQIVAIATQRSTRARTASRRSTRSRANAAARTPTTSPTA